MTGTMIGEYTEDYLLNLARDVVEKKTKGSKVLDAQAEERIPKYDAAGK
jgi:hypothetical protein